MADKEVKFDEAKWNEKLIKLNQAKEAVAGKKNYNPFLWYSTTVQPLIDKFNGGDRSKELVDALLAIPETVPVLDPNWKEEVIPPGPPVAKRA